MMVIALSVQNPCGDAVSERCQEVVGRYNSTLEVLDVHDTRMSTPATSNVSHCSTSWFGSETIATRTLRLPPVIIIDGDLVTSSSDAIAVADFTVLIPHSWWRPCARRVCCVCWGANQFPRLVRASLPVGMCWRWRTGNHRAMM